MDKRLLTLALGMFALGTDTFVMAGVLPKIAAEFNVDIGVAGQLTTLYAIAYALLAPTIAAIAGNVPRRNLMLSGLGIFILANIATALSPTYFFALVTRIFAGLGAAMYAPTATGTGASMVTPERRGQAIAIIVAGLTAATALGAPIGTVIGGLSDWRWTMYFVSGIGAAAALGIVFFLKDVPLPSKLGLVARLAPLKDARVGWTLLTTFLGMAGNFLVYIYFSVVFDRVLGNAFVFGALLVIWGTSGTVTNLVLSKVLDKIGPHKVLMSVLGLLIIDMAIVPWASAYLWSSIVAIAIWGATGWGIQSPQQYRLVGLAPNIAPVLLGLNTAATYLGVTIAGVLGALGIHVFGAHYLSYGSAAIFVLGAIAAQIAATYIASTARVAMPTAVTPVLHPVGIGK